MIEKVVPEEKARQGRRGRHMLVILVAALALTAVVWAGVEFYGERIDAQSDAQPATSAPAPAPAATP